MLSRPQVLHRPYSRQDPPDRKIARGKSLRSVGRAFGNTTWSALRSRACQRVEAADYCLAISCCDATKPIICRRDANCALTETSRLPYRQLSSRRWYDSNGMVFS